MTDNTQQNVLTLADLASKLGGEIIGDHSLIVSGVSSLDLASSGDISFVTSAKHAAKAKESNAAAVIVSSQMADVSASQLIVGSVDAALIQTLNLFAPKLTPMAGVHSSAVVEESVSMGDNVAVGPGAYISHNARIGDNTMIAAGCQIGENVVIGSNSRIDCNVMIYHNCNIGNNCTILGNTTIGATGFGYVFLEGKHQLIPHNGAVIVEDCVEIGANTCVDRAKFGNTIVGAGTKIDNLVQIAHNVVIGKCCLIVAQVGIAGSSRLGDGVIMAGQAGTSDNVTIGDRSILGSRGVAFSDLAPDGKYTGFPARNMADEQRSMACVRRLPKMVKDMKKLAKRVEELESAKNDKK